MINKFLLIVLLMFGLSACTNEKEASEIDGKQWVYIEFGEKGDESNDNLYGEISKIHLQLIERNENQNHLIKLSNARYINERGIVTEYSDGDNDQGVVYYRIEKIIYLELLKNDPLNTKVEFTEN